MDQQMRERLVHGAAGGLLVCADWGGAYLAPSMGLPGKSFTREQLAPYADLVYREPGERLFRLTDTGSAQLKALNSPAR